MSPQRIALWSLVVIAAIAAIGFRVRVMAPPPPPPRSSVMFITAGRGPYWQDTVRGAQTAAEEFNVELKVATPNEEKALAEQMEILVHLKGDQWDGVAISPVDAESQTHWINKLSAVTNVVTFDTDAKLSNRQSHVGTSNFSAGRACARIVSEALPEGGTIAVLIANQTQENLVERRSGFQEHLDRLAGGEDESGGPRLTIVAILEDGGDDQRCAQNIRQALEEHPDLDAFMGFNARHGPILLDVLGELDKLGDMKLVTFDTAPKTLDGIAAGHIYATIAQDQYKYGYEAVKILATLAYGDATQIPIVGRGSNYVGFEAVMRDNLDEFRARLRNQVAAPGEQTAG